MNVVKSTKGEIVMDEKSNNLIKSLGVAYENQLVKNNPDLKRIIAECAQPLMGNDDDKVYFEVVTKLTHGMSKYYESHQNQIPTEFLKIYQQIKTDIPDHSTNAKKLHQIAVDTGLSAFVKL